MTTFATIACRANADQPSVDALKVTLNKKLQSLKPVGTTERQVLFQEVRPGTPNGGYYPFQVTALVRDYGPGYPSNRHYGQTCVGTMDKWKFDLHRDEFGDWQVQGRMTMTHSSQCKDNPAEGASAFPLSTLQGTPAPATPAGGAAVPSTALARSALATGEWACFGTGGRILFGFYLQPDGSYLDGDRKRAGTYKNNPSAATITFSGGPMDGQVGKNVRGRSFQLTATASCEAS